MAAPKPPLDEVAHRQPLVIEWWLNGPDGVEPPFVPMEERMIHRYIAESPFFDWTSKNGLMLAQSQNNWELYHKVHNLKEFNDAVKKRPGLEYQVVGVPEPAKAMPGGVSLGTSGVYVIRKLERSNEKGSDPSNPYPHTELRGTYYIIGDVMFQAPSVADSLGAKLLKATTSLSKMMETAKELSSFTPTTGHTYLPQSNKPTAGASSVHGSPSKSREGSVVPGMETQSLRSGSVAPPDSQTGGAAIATSTADYRDAQLLAASLQQSIQYGDEYMDENPLLGEPGKFSFTSSTAAVQKRKRDEEAAALAAQRAREVKISTSAAASPKFEKVATPPAVFSEAKASASATKTKESKEERKKRRKSRPAGSATSPTTPGSANPLSGGVAG